MQQRGLLRHSASLRQIQTAQTGVTILFVRVSKSHLGLRHFLQAGLHLDMM